MAVSGALVPVQTCPSPASIEDARGREADVGDTNSKPATLGQGDICLAKGLFAARLSTAARISGVGTISSHVRDIMIHVVIQKKPVLNLVGASSVKVSQVVVKPSGKLLQSACKGHTPACQLIKGVILADLPVCFEGVLSRNLF